MGKFGEIDSADTCAGKFPLASMGAEQRVSRAQTQEQGPPSMLAEILSWGGDFAMNIGLIFVSMMNIEFYYGNEYCNICISWLENDKLKTSPHLFIFIW